MVTGIIGRKVGMTQVFAQDGTVSPATVIKAGPCVVVQAKAPATDGYEAVQLGLVEEKPARVRKPLAGHYKKAGVPPTRVRREVKLASGAEPLKAGDQVLVGGVFNNGDRVDVIGISRGKGFQGVVRRHHFRGGAATHGSMFHRAPGSIGASSFPSRVVKGMRAGGRMGGDRVTVRNLKVVQVDGENNLLVLHGAVPGAPGGYVVIRKAIAAKKVSRAAGGEADEGGEGKEVSVALRVAYETQHPELRRQDGRHDRFERRRIRRPREDGSRSGRRWSRRMRRSDAARTRRRTVRSSAAAARSRTSRRARGGRRSVRAGLRCGARAARCSDRSRAATNLRCRRRSASAQCRAALSQKLSDGAVIVVDKLETSDGKTKGTAEMFRRLGRVGQGTGDRREAG